MSVHYLESIRWPLLPIINYRGCEVVKTVAGYTVLRQNVTTPSEVDQAIDLAAKQLQKSIK